MMASGQICTYLLIRSHLMTQHMRKSTLPVEFALSTFHALHKKGGHAPVGPLGAVSCPAAARRAA